LLSFVFVDLFEPMAEREHDKIEVAKKKMPINNDDNVEPTKSIDDLPKLQYAIEDVPPWYICIVLGLQVGMSDSV